jgi:hypothetical protein
MLNTELLDLLFSTTELCADPEWIFFTTNKNNVTFIPVFKHHTMKTWQGVEENMHAFLCSTLNTSEW